MAAAAILKNLKIAISDQSFDDRRKIWHRNAGSCHMDSECIADAEVQLHFVRQCHSYEDNACHAKGLGAR